MPVSSDTFGHASLFGLTRSYTDEVDAALKELLATGG
jgi:hypothetical protein